MKKLRFLIVLGLFLIVMPVLANHRPVGGGCGFCGIGVDNLYALQDTQLSSPAPGVLDNDDSVSVFDENGLELTENDVISKRVVGAETGPIIVSEPEGMLTLYEDGSFTFDPTPGYCIELFYDVELLFYTTYTAEIIYDRGPAQDPYIYLFEDIEIVIDISCRVWAIPDNYSLDGSLLTVDASSGLLSNDSGVQLTPGEFPEPLDIPLVAALLEPPRLHEYFGMIGGQPELGEVSVAPDGSFVYEPDPLALQAYCAAPPPEPITGYHETFWYEATMVDSSYSDYAYVVIELCNTPLFFADDFEVRTLEDTPLTIDLLSNVVEVPAGSGFVLTVDSIGTVEHGSVILNDSNGADFTPEAEWSGVLTLEYTLTDGILSDTGIITIVVEPVNDAPECIAQELTLWSPNHTIEPINYTGFTDIDSTEFDITVNSITSNENVNGIGDGNTDPDWSVEDAWVRVERSGTGNGRVYSVELTVDDTNWINTFDDPDGYLDEVPAPVDEDPSNCTGSMTIRIPHDMGNNQTGNGNNGLGNSGDNGNAQGVPQRDNNNGNNQTGNGNNGLGNSGDNGNAQGEPQRDNNNGNRNSNGNGNGQGN